MVTALQAKLVARLLVADGLPWKSFFLQWLHRDRACLLAHPTLPARLVDHLGYGLRVLFTTLTLATASIPPRQLAYLAAFRLLRPHRASADPLAFLDILQEPLWFSNQVTDGRGRPLTGSHVAPLLAFGVATVGQLLAIGPTLPAAEASMASSVRQLLPAAWVETLGVAQAASAGGGMSSWSLHPAMGIVLCQPGGLSVGNAGAQHAYHVLPSGALQPMPHAPPVGGTDLLPVHVVSYVEPGTSGLHLVSAVSASGLWNAGLWAFGTRPLPAYAVREGCQRAVLVKGVGSDASFQPGRPVRPRIWEDDWGAGGVPAQGLRACEACWRRPEPVVGGRRPAGAPLDVPSWQRRSAPRMAPRDRTELPTSPPVPVPLIDAPSDPLTLSPHARQPWGTVWSDLLDGDLDRTHRVLAWRILHASVMCGAFARHVHQLPEQASAACPHVGCAGVLQDLSHLFLTCPLADAVWHWISQVWVLLAGGSPPPLAASVLLAGDRRVWQPAQAFRAVWLRLRLLTLHELWKAACKARMQACTVTAHGIALRLLAGFRKLLARDWFRVDMRLSDLGACPQWLLARNPTLTVQSFQQRWGPSGAFFSFVAAAGSKPKVHILWDADTPASVPAVPQMVPFFEPQPANLDLFQHDSDVDMYESD